MLPSINTTLDFQVPKTLLKSIPTEIRGIARDEVKLLVSKINTDSLFHTSFQQIDRFLRPGDTLVVNTSATIPAAVEVILPTGQQGRLHLSNQLGNGYWLSELRQLVDGQPKRFFGAQEGDQIQLPGNGLATLVKPHYNSTTQIDHLHLWEVELQLPVSASKYLASVGKPIRYDERNYPIEYYQTAFATEPGSAEMPSAGRAFTHPLITRLLLQGIQFAPILLHTGVSSVEVDELPYPEYFRVPSITASLLNRAKQAGQRIIAVGTTAVRAVESAIDKQGKVQAKAGWTDRYITPEDGPQIINGLLTGFHEPQASHLQMLEAIAGQQHLAISYQAALEKAYHWHEFGDLHLMI